MYNGQLDTFHQVYVMNIVVIYFMLHVFIIYREIQCTVYRLALQIYKSLALQQKCYLLLLNTL